MSITKKALEELERMLFEQGTLGKFIRSILGLDINAAKVAFANLLIAKNLNSQQIRFIDLFISYLSVKSAIDPSMLFESPFTDLSSSGISGLFDD